MSTSQRDELIRIIGELYYGRPRVKMLLQRLRPYICPFEELLCEIDRPVSILDIGCGAGLFLNLLTATGYVRQGIGYDPSEAAIAVARTAQQRLPAEYRSLLEFRSEGNLPEGKFDIVSMVDVLHHVPVLEQRELFQQAVNRLNPNGILLFKDMARRPHWKAWVNRLHDLIVAKQWIHYRAVADVERWGEEAGLHLQRSADLSRLCYQHELRVFCWKDSAKTL